MPRLPRDTGAGLFHVFTHCVWAAPAHFRDDVDRTVFLRHLATTVAKAGWTCAAYCLMGTHYHLIVAVEEGAFSRGMHRLNLAYARDFNGRHRLRGHVQHCRYGARRIGDDEDLQNVYRYVINNPVRSGEVEVAHQWDWSSYAATVGLAERQSFVDDSLVFAAFGGDPATAAGAIRSFVEAA